MGGRPSRRALAPSPPPAWDLLTPRANHQRQQCSPPTLETPPTDAPSGGGAGNRASPSITSAPNSATREPNARVGGRPSRRALAPSPPTTHSMGMGGGMAEPPITVRSSMWPPPAYPPKNPERVGVCPPSNRTPDDPASSLPGRRQYRRQTQTLWSGMRSLGGGQRGGRGHMNNVRARTTRVCG